MISFSVRRMNFRCWTSPFIEVSCWAVAATGTSRILMVFSRIRDCSCVFEHLEGPILEPYGTSEVSNVGV